MQGPVFSRIDFLPLLRKGGKWILDDSLGVYAPEAALGGFPGGRASHGEAGKGRKAPYGVLRRERCLHAVCSERWEGQGTKTPLHRLLPLLSRLSRGGRLGRPWGVV